MSKIKQGFFYLFISLLAGSPQLHAAEHQHKEHEAHVHGKAQLLVALEGNTLEIEFLSPAMNIVGFEHQPAHETQFRAIESAVETLKQPGLLFGLPSAAKCHPITVQAESPLDEHREHEQDHDHSKQASHDHEEETHGDFKVNYGFRCVEISRLDSIAVKIFKKFPGTEVIVVQSISKQGQRRIVLTPDNNTLEL